MEEMTKSLVRHPRDATGLLHVLGVRNKMVRRSKQRTHNHHETIAYDISHETVNEITTFWEPYWYIRLLHPESADAEAHRCCILPSSVARLRWPNVAPNTRRLRAT